MKPQLTIEAFADWCEKQPPEKEYNYCDEPHCAMSQFVKSIGFDTEAVVDCLFGGVYFRLSDGRQIDLPQAFSDAAIADPQTFGALASRLRRSAS